MEVLPHVPGRIRVQGGVSRERVLYVLPVPRVKKSVRVRQRRFGVYGSAVKDNANCG